MGGISRTGRGRGRARAEIAVVRVLEKRLGALPVVAQFGRRLRIAEVVDELCPVRPVAPVSHGEVIEALVANRLTAPAPLVRVEAWAAAMAVDEVYGIEAHLLNDDRLGRALDAVAPHLDEVIGSVGAAAISEFGVDVARLHWDMTSISLYGAYPEADEEYPAPRWGHPKDRRPDLKQIQAGLAVSGDGGIPVFHHAYDGGAGEVAQVTGAMTALKKIAGRRTFLLVGDSKLVSYANASAMAAGQVAFVAPLAAARVPAGLFAALPAGAGTAVDYTAGRDAGKPAAARAAYRVLEDDGMDIRGPRKSDPVVHLRRILVYSSANAAGQARARALKLAKAATELDKLVRTAGTRFHPTAEAVAARVQAIAAQRRAGKYLRTAITAGPAGKPVLAWHFDQDAIDAEAAGDGWYALLTNLAPDQAGPAGVFRRYKGQHVVERRYGEFKGPLAVAPIFLELNRRITALITVICLALLIFCLVERQVRQALAPHGEMMTGLPGYGPAPARPTGRTIFRALADLRLIPAHDGNPATIPRPAGVQARLLDLLQIDISRPRWPTR
ncbi:MAG TPA: IS1634 family transposase [Streptosporangiaceae bacterium]|nr:IS1634 family transposase [Streptosporangiaceae bacterium]